MAQQHNLHRRRASADELHYVSLHLKQKPLLWDCGSSLYDSFELFTFTQHLERAIAAAEPQSSSASIMKDRRARSLSLPHFAYMPTSQLYNSAVKEDEPMPDIDFSHLSKIEPLHPKTRSRLRLPKLVQRLFTRLARDGNKSRSGAKQNDLQSKAGRTPFERILYTAVHYC
ncbi:hypothetical protein SUGI_0268840 [Cryptomeria japonica]|nr:hypothetical protein SUGI_0268840 [Cryptomeria japonica]